MSRARTFLKCEIVDAIEAAARLGMEVRILPTGEMRIVHSNPQANSIDENHTTDADKALAAWEAKHGGKVEGTA